MKPNSTATDKQPVSISIRSCACWKIAVHFHIFINRNYTTASRPVAVSRERRPTPTNSQGVAESREVSPDPPLLQPGPPQLAQPDPSQLPRPSLDALRGHRRPRRCGRGRSGAARSAPHECAAGTAAPRRGSVPPSAEPPPRTRAPVPRPSPDRRSRPSGAPGGAEERRGNGGGGRPPEPGRGGAVGAGGRALPAALPPAALGGRAVPAAARRLFLLLLISSSSSSSSWPLRRGGCGRSGGAMSGAAAAKSEKLDEAQALARSCAGRPDFQPCDGLSLCATHSHGRCFRLHWCCHLGWCHCE